MASRRAAEKIIQERQVKVNGKVITEVTIINDSDLVEVNNRVVQRRHPCYYAVHKPIHYICSNYDPYSRPLTIDLIPNSTQQHVFTVGRLDWLSSGLIIVTNDGYFARRIMMPANHIEKEYIVESSIEIPIDKLRAYYQPKKFKDVFYSIKNATHTSPNDPHEVTITLIDGKKRAIRNIMESIQVPIMRLHRVRIGSIHLADLPAGGFRTLTAQELRQLSPIHKDAA